MEIDHQEREGHTVSECAERKCKDQALIFSIKNRVEIAELHGATLLTEYAYVRGLLVRDSSP